jgi:hypothetical protein
MDGLTAVVLLWIATVLAAFAVGKWAPQADLAAECASKNEIVISGKIYQCRPIAVYIDGKRVELRE